MNRREAIEGPCLPPAPGAFRLVTLMRRLTQELPGLNVEDAFVRRAAVGADDRLRRGPAMFEGDLPQAVEKLSSLKDKTVVTVCTGGVRCEKMSAYLMQQGFKDVYQLEDGMHGYMEKYPAQDFRGTLYTFDNRLVMDFGAQHEIVGQCLRCKSATEQYVNCANLACHLHFLVCSECNDERGVYCSEACSSTKVGPL